MKKPVASKQGLFKVAVILLAILVIGVAANLYITDHLGVSSHQIVSLVGSIQLVQPAYAASDCGGEAMGMTCGTIMTVRCPGDWWNPWDDSMKVICKEGGSDQCGYYGSSCSPSKA